MRVGPWSDGISAHIRRDIRELDFFPSAMGGHSKKASYCELGRELSTEPNHASTPILDLQPPEQQQNQFLFLKPLNLRHFVMTTQAN